MDQERQEPRKAVAFSSQSQAECDKHLDGVAWGRYWGRMQWRWLRTNGEPSATASPAETLPVPAGLTGTPPRVHPVHPTRGRVNAGYTGGCLAPSDVLRRKWERAVLLLGKKWRARVVVGSKCFSWQCQNCWGYRRGNPGLSTRRGQSWQISIMSLLRGLGWVLCTPWTCFLTCKIIHWWAFWSLLVLTSFHYN